MYEENELDDEIDENFEEGDFEEEEHNSQNDYDDDDYSTSDSEYEEE